MPPDHPAHRVSVQKLFITGLLTLLPIWLTWVVIKFVFVLLSDISKPWVEPLSHRIAATFPQSLGWFNGLWVQNTIAMVATLFVIVAVGAMTRRVVGQRLLRWFEALIAQRARHLAAYQDERLAERFLGIVYGGRIPDGMPSFQGHLDVAQAEAVHQYLIKRAYDLQEQQAATKKTASN